MHWIGIQAVVVAFALVRAYSLPLVMGWRSAALLPAADAWPGNYLRWGWNLLLNDVRFHS